MFPEFLSHIDCAGQCGGKGLRTLSFHFLSDNSIGSVVGDALDMLLIAVISILSKPNPSLVVVSSTEHRAPRRLCSLACHNCTVLSEARDDRFSYVYTAVAAAQSDRAQSRSDCGYTPTTRQLRRRAPQAKLRRSKHASLFLKKVA